MRLEDIEKLPLTKQLQFKIAAVNARMGFDMYESNIAYIANLLNIQEIGKAKQIAYNYNNRFENESSFVVMDSLSVIKSLLADQVYSELMPFQNSITANQVSKKHFKRVYRDIKSVNSDYTRKDYEGYAKKGHNIFSIADMINDGSLSEFLDRLFTKKEGMPMSHDKTSSVLSKLEQAFKEDINIPLVSYFTEENTKHVDEPEELIGHRTYWSTDVFKDTDEVIAYLTEHFFLD